MTTISRSYTLSNGVEMPSVGLGTYRVQDEEMIDACILEALRSGYRLIDTAAVYRNEVAIGKSLKRILEQNLVPGLTRQDIFLTSKLAPKDQGYEACYQAVQASLENLQVDYIDLYLIHWPGTTKLKQSDPQNAINRAGSWRALEDLYHAKKLRAIGVSNYTLRHLTQLVDQPQSVATAATPGLTETEQASVARTMVVPHVHQFELHPRLLQMDLIQFCQQHRIQVQAYSSLGEGRLVSLTPSPPPEMDAHYNTAPMPGPLDIMPDLIRKYFPTPSNIATTDVSSSMEVDGQATSDPSGTFIINDDALRQKEYSKRAAQILLRWGLQHGAVVIPKSTHPERIRNNIDLFSFEIDQNDMIALDAYSLPGEQTRYCWNPTDVF